MTSAHGGGPPKAELVMEVAWVLHYKSVAECGPGVGVKNANFCGRHMWMDPQRKCDVRPGPVPGFPREELLRLRERGL